MAVANRKEFIACITKSKVIPADKLKEWLDSVNDEGPKKIAAKLIQDELLTPWQAKFLLSGRSRLSIGNYILQTRTSRDELGDKFKAFHSQLNRKVVIQVFPSSVSKNEGLLNKLLAKLRAITELDHPNLVHVYDVDQEGERYFLVTEYVGGQSLNLVSPKNLTDSEIALIVQGIGAGLAYSHEHDIIHGNVLPEKIIVKPNGKAELEGFPSATLIEEANSDAKPPTEGSDFRRLSKIGLALLKKLPEDSRSEDHGKLTKLIAGLKTSEDREASLASLEDWVSTHTAAADSSSSLELQSEDDSFLSSDKSTEGGDFDNPMSTVASTTLKKKKAPTETDEPQSRGFLKTMWEDKRTAFITLAAALLLLFAGGLVTLGIAIGGGTGSPASQSLVATKDNKDANNIKPDKPNSRKAVSKTLDPEANREKLEEFFKERDNKQKTPKEKRRESREQKAAAAEANKAAEDSEPKPSKKTAADTEVKVKDADAANAEQNSIAAAQAKKKAEEEAEASSSEPAEGKKKAAAKPPSKRPAKIGNPFEKFVKSVDLPAETDSQDFKIADLVIEKSHLLGLKLLSEPMIARPKIEFKLNRSADDKQLWNVELIPKRADPIAVAQFQKTPTEIKFRWLPAAAEEKNANYLSNCLLELATPKDSIWLRLRSPKNLSEFAFGEDPSSAELELEIPWLPNSQFIKVELQPFNIGTRADVVGFEPREFGVQDAGRIFFRERPADRFFFVEVAVDLRKKAKLQAQTTVLLPNGKMQSLRSMDDLAKFSIALGNEARSATSRSEQLDQIRANTRPPNMSNDELVNLRKEAKASASNLTKSFELTQKYAELIKKLPGKVIPLQIYFEMENHRIVLAESKASK